MLDRLRYPCFCLIDATKDRFHGTGSQEGSNALLPPDINQRRSRASGTRRRFKSSCSEKTTQHLKRNFFMSVPTTCRGSGQHKGKTKVYGGSGGIRTHGELPHGGFQDRCLKPLGHTSVLHTPSRNARQGQVPCRMHSENGHRALICLRCIEGRCIAAKILVNVTFTIGSA